MGDLAGRLGGDEFVVFLDNVSNEEALRKCADKINRVLVKNYEKADLALYEMKRQGRNGYKIWNEQE